jgi:hypothetical protein
MVELLDPTCEARPEAKPLAPRPAALSGLRLALLDNTKPNVGPFYAALRAVLLARVPLAAATIYRKRDSSSPLPDEVERAILADADVIVNAMAD